MPGIHMVCPNVILKHGVVVWSFIIYAYDDVLWVQPDTGKPGKR